MRQLTEFIGPQSGNNRAGKRQARQAGRQLSHDLHAVLIDLAQPGRHDRQRHDPQRHRPAGQELLPQQQRQDRRRADGQCEHVGAGRLLNEPADAFEEVVAAPHDA